MPAHPAALSVLHADCRKDQFHVDNLSTEVTVVTRGVVMLQSLSTGGKSSSQGSTLLELVVFRRV